MSSTMIDVEKPISFEVAKELATSSKGLTCNLATRKLTYYGKPVQLDLESFPFKTEEQFFALCEQIYDYVYRVGVRCTFTSKPSLEVEGKDAFLTTDEKFFSRLLKIVIIAGARSDLVRWRWGFFWQSKKFPKLIIYRNWLLSF